MKRKVATLFALQVDSTVRLEMKRMKNRKSWRKGVKKIEKKRG